MYQLKIKQCNTNCVLVGIKCDQYQRYIKLSLVLSLEDNVYDMLGYSEKDSSLETKGLNLHLIHALKLETVLNRLCYWIKY